MSTTKNLNSEFNFDSFFNKKIVDIAPGETITSVVASLNDADFEALCGFTNTAAEIAKSEIFDTGVTERATRKILVPSNLNLILDGFNTVAKTAIEFCQDKTNPTIEFGLYPSKNVFVGDRPAHTHHICVYYIYTPSRSEREKHVVDVLGNRKGKVIAKRLSKQRNALKAKEAAAAIPEAPKRITIGGVEFELVPVADKK